MAAVAAREAKRKSKPVDSFLVNSQASQEDEVKDYLIQVSYTSEAMAALISNVQNREDAVRPVVEKLGGSLKTAHFALGDMTLF